MKKRWNGEKYIITKNDEFIFRKESEKESPFVFTLQLVSIIILITFIIF